MYKGCGASLSGLHPSNTHLRWSTHMCKCCGDSLRYVDPSRIHGTWSNAMYKRYGECLRVYTPKGFTAGGVLRCKSADVKP